MVVIPGGLTSVLQPLDVCINRPFKVEMKKRYTQWMEKADLEYTPTGKIKRPDVTRVCGWIRSAWDSIELPLVEKSFKKFFDFFESDIQDSQVWMIWD